MSIKQRSVPAPPYRLEDYVVCDNPKCAKPNIGCYEPYELIGGYGSTVMDCEQRHFCSMRCLREWVNEGEFAAVQE